MMMLNDDMNNEWRERKRGSDTGRGQRNEHQIIWAMQSNEMFCFLYFLLADFAA
jgi:hypothetical protein